MTSQRARASQRESLIPKIFKQSSKRRERRQICAWPSFLQTTKRQIQDKLDQTELISDIFLHFAFHLLLGRCVRIPQICPQSYNSVRQRYKNHDNEGFVQRPAHLSRTYDPAQVISLRSSSKSHKNFATSSAPLHGESKTEIYPTAENVNYHRINDENGLEETTAMRRRMVVVIKLQIPDESDVSVLPANDTGKGRKLNEIFIGSLSTNAFIEVTEAIIVEALRLSDRNPKPLPSADDEVSAFYGVGVPSISIRDYFRRLVEFAEASASAFVVMLIYIKRIGQCTNTLQLNEYNLHRVAITALTLACKIVDDQVFSNSHYAHVGGVSSSAEMTTLEVLFLNFINHYLFVDNAQFSHKVNELATMYKKLENHNGHGYSGSQHTVSTRPAFPSQRCHSTYCTNSIPLNQQGQDRARRHGNGDDEDEEGEENGDDDGIGSDEREKVNDDEGGDDVDSEDERMDMDKGMPSYVSISHTMEVKEINKTMDQVDSNS